MSEIHISYNQVIKDNSDLSPSFISDIMQAMHEITSGEGVLYEIESR